MINRINFKLLKKLEKGLTISLRTDVVHQYIDKIDY